MKLDLMVFGPHPDDLELGLGGVVARYADEGRAVGLCDLTAGELGSNGTSTERLEEASEASQVLGARWRINLGWPDGDLDPTPERIGQVVDMVRRFKPRTIAIPYWQDRHPDHVAASRTLYTGIFKAGLRRHEAEGDPWRPDWICYYFINDAVQPSFVVDVSKYYEAKRAALACHRSQFGPTDPGAVPTRLTAPTFRQLIESRDAQFGALTGVAFAEGVVVREPVTRLSLQRADA